MNFSKIALSIGFLTIIGGMTTKAPLNVNASSSPTVLRFAQGDLGSANQSLTDFNIQGSGVTVAKNTNKGIVMTTGGAQASSVFLKQQLAADATRPGFSTYFVMNVYRLDPGPADGYVFVIAANSSSLGATGGGLGYSTITNSVGIEFDFYNNGGEQMASSDVFQNGNSAFTSGTVFDSGYMNRWNSVGTGGLVRAFHTWIEYDHASSRLELRVATSNNESPTLNRPARPASALLTRNTSYSQISNFFYAGFTAGTGGLMQQMSLKSWYMSNAYIAGGINPDANQILVDSTPPTAPSVQAIESNNNQYSLNLSGGTDDTGVAGYQYKIPSGNWVNYVSPVVMSTLGEYQARTVDLAGNYSSSVTSIHLYKINFSAGGTIRNSVFRVNTDPSFSIDYEYFDGTYLYRQWYTSSGFSGDPLTSIASRTTSITIFGKPIQNVFTVGYVLNGGQVSSANPSLYIANTTLELNEPSKEGHTFAGWFLNAGFTLSYNPEQMPTSNFILYASYSTNLYTVSIILNDDEATTYLTSLPYQTNLDNLLQSWETDIEDNIYQKVGHTFSGWYVNDNPNLPWIDGSTLLSNVTIYAQWSILSYQVNYALPNGESYSTAVVTFGNAVVFPSDPILFGFTFVGWSDGVNLVADGLIMNANPLALTAVFDRNNYGLTFQTNSGSILEDFTLPFESNISDYLPTPLSKSGYSFAGWYLNDAFTVALNDDTLLTETTTLFAKWEINSYTLTINNNNGNAIDSTVVTFADQITLPSNPVKEGFTFVGWYTNESLTTPYQSQTMPANNLTLFAKWDLNTYRINFYANHGVLTSTSMNYPFGQSLPTLEVPTREGYSFQGWFLDESLNLPYNINTMPAGNIDLFAKWEINDYTVSFETFGGTSITSVLMTFNDAILLPNDPVKEGFTFVAWYTDESLTSPYQSQTMPANDLTLFAKWDLNSYRINFYTNDGVLNSTSINYAFEQPLPALEVPTREGHTFQGWFLDESFLQPFNYQRMPSRQLDVFAKWEINTYTLSINNNNGSSMNSTVVTFADQITLPEDPVKEGYTFVGWYTDESLTNPYQAQTMPANNLTLFAKWDVNSYQINFNSNDGTLTSTSANFTFQENLPILETPSREGHSFQGWFFDESLTIPFDIDTMPAGDIDLFAKWEANTYTLTINTNGGNNIASTSVTYGQQPNLTNDPVRNGYAFTGWRAGDVMIDENWTMPDSDVVITAVWEGLSSQAIFISPNQTTILSTTSGETIGSLPTVEVKPGFIFLGWSLAVGDATQIVDESFVVENGLTIRLYPIWVKTSDPALIMNQYFALGVEQMQSYTFEIIMFTSLMLVGIAGFIFYIKKESYAR
jgi:uncharacterized repeat protein (TIGR02543 family)